MIQEPITTPAILIVLLYLAVSSVFDIRKKAIPLLLPLLLIAAAVVWDVRLYIVCGRDGMTYERILALMPGALFLAISLMTDRKVGLGDGLSLLGMGQFTGAAIVFLTMCAGLFLSAVLSCVLILTGKAKRSLRIPFLPFLGAGFVLVLEITK